MMSGYCLPSTATSANSDSAVSASVVFLNFCHFRPVRIRSFYCIRLYRLLVSATSALSASAASTSALSLGFLRFPP